MRTHFAALGNLVQKTLSLFRDAEFYRFCAVGLPSQGVYYGSYGICSEWLGWNPYQATALSFVLYVLINTFLVKHWAYRSSGNWGKHLLLYGGTHVFNQAYGFGLLFIMVEWVDLWHYYAQFTLTVIYFLVNLLVSRRLFSHHGS